MRRSSWLLGAVMAVFFGVGCGPLDPEELSEQGQALKATPILLGASCPTESTCGLDYRNCTEWTAPSSCGGSSTSSLVQYQSCFDAQGNQCLNVSFSTVSVGG